MDKLCGRMMNLMILDLKNRYFGLLIVDNVFINLF